MSDATPFDSKQFRNVLGSFPTGVTVVTLTDADGKKHGVTANSFSSVSLEPPLVLWSIAKTSTSYDAFMAAKYWNVHFLAADQQDLSGNFARSGTDKFADISCTEGIFGAPVLSGCTAVLQCEIEHQYAGGDHTILVARVHQFDSADNAPLVFASGAYAQLA